MRLPNSRELTSCVTCPEDSHGALGFSVCPSNSVLHQPWLFSCYSLFAQGYFLSVIVPWKNLTYFLGLKGLTVKSLTCFRAVFDLRLSDKGGIFDTSWLWTRYIFHLRLILWFKYEMSLQKDSGMKFWFLAIGMILKCGKNLRSVI